MAPPLIAECIGSVGDGRDYRPVLTGVVERRTATQFRIRGPWSALELTSLSRTSEWLDVLMQLDGRASAADIATSSALDSSEVLRTIQRLAEDGLVTDAAAPWSTFHQASRNPARLHPRATSATGITTRWQPPGYAPSQRIDPAVLSLSPFMAGDGARCRRSFDRDATFAIDPEASEAFALRLAHNGYRRIDACRRPVASAGGLEPIHLLTIGCNRTCDQRRVLALNDSGDTCFELDRFDPDQLKAALAPDPVIAGIVRSGAAVIAICADHRRVVGKYGDRGWRYALLEAGAVSHEIALLATLIGLSLRPVGGFFDDALAAWTPSLLPLLLMVVIVEQSDA